MSGTADVILMAETAAKAVRELAHLTRPAITDLNQGDLYDITGTLTDLIAALPQVLTQLAAYPAADAAAECLAHAARIAAELATVLDTTHQTLD